MDDESSQLDQTARRDLNPPDYWKLWAKVDPKTERWHSLPCHLLDVAATAGELWDRLPKVVKAHVAAWFQSETAAKPVTVLLTALHDIGKCNRYFQGKALSRRPELTSFGVNGDLEPARHGQATNALLANWLHKNLGWSRATSNVVASGVGGHHGVFFGKSDLTTLGLNDDLWRSMATDLMNDIKGVITYDGSPPSAPDCNAFLAWLSGFVSVADWLGSHEQMTVWQETPCEFQVYYEQAQVRAKALFDSLSLRWPDETKVRAPAALVPEGSDLNGMQSAAKELASSDWQFAIIEGPTGEGKTEAAFILAEQARAEGRGIYVALPTMATANGIYGRVGRFLEEGLGSSGQRPRLLHSMAWLENDHFVSVENPNDGNEPSVAEDWFAASKRGLIYPYGAGTIDQLLIASLNVKHFFVRLFGLAGKVVILDEVHAYDIYMSTLLESSLAWLKSLGCKVILLSATLPKAKRESLLRAWGCESQASSRYPSITVVDRQGNCDSRSFEVRERKPLQIRYHEQGSALHTAAILKDLVDQVVAIQGTGAVVMNTVRGAQETFDKIRSEIAPDDCEVMLFHARYTVRDRHRREKSVLERFGKQRVAGKPAILIATQVVEQSLDLDFDFMVSELAPIDLLIQRAGRLHRHSRDELGGLLPQGQQDQRPDPVLWVIDPTPRDNSEVKIGGQVYEILKLIRTHMVVAEGLTIRKPEDVSLAVSSVYDDDPVWEQRLQDSSTLIRYLTQQTERDRRDTQTAECAAIERPDHGDPITLYRNIEISDEELGGRGGTASTRLSDLPSIRLVLQYDDQTVGPGPYCLERLKQLAQNTVTLSAGASLIHELRGLGRGENWGRHAMLREAVLARLNHSQQFETTSYILEYSDMYGLSWRKKNA